MGISVSTTWIYRWIKRDWSTLRHRNVLWCANLVRNRWFYGATKIFRAWSGHSVLCREPNSNIAVSRQFEYCFSWHVWRSTRLGQFCQVTWLQLETNRAFVWQHMSRSAASRGSMLLNMGLRESPAARFGTLWAMLKFGKDRSNH